MPVSCHQPTFTVASTGYGFWGWFICNQSVAGRTLERAIGAFGAVAGRLYERGQAVELWAIACADIVDDRWAKRSLPIDKFGTELHLGRQSLSGVSA